MKISTSAAIVGLTLSLCALIDATPGLPLHTGFIGPAKAIIGRPMTPFSYAGVARRSVYRGAVYAAPIAMATTAVVVGNDMAYQAAANNQAVYDNQAAYGAPSGAVITQLPAGCITTPVNGVEYYTCNGVKYRTAFQGNNVVYVSE